VPDQAKFKQKKNGLSLTRVSPAASIDTTMSLLHTRTFVDSRLQVIPFAADSAPWRLSIYALCIRDGDILLVKESDSDMYDLPGGGVDDGETFDQTLQREAREEAGVQELKIGKIITATQDWFYHRKGVFYQTVQLIYEAEVIGELDTPSDKRMTFNEWVPLEKAKKLSLFPMLSKVLENFTP
jgi:8-oxo-dGTP pyrophosphatase MutT (NUDIX family)